MSPVRKHSVTIRGHRTSFSLEQPFLDELRAIAAARDVTFAALIAQVDAERPRAANLSSALRIFVLDQVKQNATPDEDQPTERPLTTGG
ncbi:MAG: ribbon-helix-helix domain-containing protein [Pseudomonadota bacterium]|nr:ribbon-helix-helix domain-containing protein [Pseudomonadota bacterium]MDQ2704269.1 ribbon-helix-helix domain-containing protein [Pseudomonadota bacterium]